MPVHHRYAAEIADYMVDYEPERHRKALETPAENERMIEVYELVCSNGCPKTVFRSERAPTCCPHCYSTFIEAKQALRLVKVVKKPASSPYTNRRNGRKHEPAEPPTPSPQTDKLWAGLEAKLPARDREILKLLRARRVMGKKALMERYNCSLPTISTTISRLRANIPERIVFDRAAQRYRLVEEEEEGV